MVPNHDIFRQTKKGLEIRVRVIPNSCVESVCFREGETLTVKLKVPPVDGRANRELIRVISRKLGTAPSKISICRGHTSRDKVLLVEKMTEQDALDSFKTL